MGELFDRPFNFRIGYRYEETDVTSNAESQSYSRIEWASTNEFTAVPAEGALASGLTGNYDASLPNIDFDIEIIDNVVFRASFSETIARPSYGDLRGNLSVGQVLQVSSQVKRISQ